jgi:predicted metallopeptidase
MGRRAKVWEVREDYRPLLYTVKELFPTILGHVRVKRVFLCGFMNPSSAHIARIHANRPPWSLAMPDYDYAIQFWSTRFDVEAKAYKYFVVLHELMHVPRGGFDRSNPFEYRKCIDHDVEDFRTLLKSYGIYMEDVKDILKGEQGLFRAKEGPLRFPRIAKLG